MNITIQKLLDELKLQNINIIDLRSKYQYDLGHIEKSKNIPMNYLLINPEYYLNKNELYYIYCQYGNLSKSTVNHLNSMGYKTINIIGGYNEYEKMKSN